MKREVGALKEAITACSDDAAGVEEAEVDEPQVGPGPGACRAPYTSVQHILHPAAERALGAARARRKAWGAAGAPPVPQVICHVLKWSRFFVTTP